MADYFTQFSCVLDVRTAANAEQALLIFHTIEQELNSTGENLGFEMTTDASMKAGALWLHSDGHGEPEHVVDFVLRCAETFVLTGRWSFTWGLSCSRPRLDGFGGGARILDLGERKTVAWIDTAHWADEQVNAGLITAPREEVAVPAAE